MYRVGSGSASRITLQLAAPEDLCFYIFIIDLQSLPRSSE